MEEEECLACWECLTDETSCEYSFDGDSYKPSAYCLECLAHVIETHFVRWCDKVYKANCKKELRGLLDAGPPIYLNEKDLGISKSSQNITMYRFANEKPKSAKLLGCLEGQERQDLWSNCKKNFEALPEEELSEKEIAKQELSEKEIAKEELSKQKLSEKEIAKEPDKEPEGNPK